MDQQWLYTLVLLAPPFLLTLTVHEFAHARTALAFGDPTAKYMGRVTLNPLAHLDPVGTLVLFLTRAFGWAKPVPVNPSNFTNRKLGEIAVSAAGVAANFGLGLMCGLALRCWLAWGGEPLTYYESHPVYIMLFFTMRVNFVLCIFNLIPLFPLDGHHILRELLPPSSQQGFTRWQMQYGRFALMLFIVGPWAWEMFTNTRAPIDPIGFILTRLINPLIRFIIS